MHQIKPCSTSVRAPSIHLSFNLAAVLPGSRFNACPEATPQGHNLQIDIVYGVDYGVSNHCLLPRFRYLSVSLCRGRAPPVFLRSLRISPLHGIHPLYKTLACQFYRMQFPRLSPVSIRLDRPPACAFALSNSINACLRIAAAAGAG